MLEPLEPRLLLSSDLAYTALADADLTLRVQEVGGVEMLQIINTHDPAAVLASQILAGIDGSSGFGARIDGNGHDIRLTLDASVDAGRIAGGVIFDGGPGESTIIGPDRASTWRVGGSGSGDVDGVRFQGVDRIVGGSDADTLIGPDTPTAWNYAKWTLTGENAGAIGATDFEGIENLQGGAGADLFVFNPGGGLTGRIEGGSGLDSVKAGDGANEWAILASDAGTLNGLAFLGIENLYGGAGADRFILADGGRVGGVVSGGGGLDLIAGTDAGADWRIQGTNSGTVDGQAFKGIESLIGGAGADRFTFSGAGQVTGLIAGGAGADSLRASDGENVWNLTATNVGSLNGQVFSGIESLAGGAGGDRFLFAAGAGISGTLDGGAGENLLDYSAYAAPVQVDLNAGTASGTAGIGRVQNVTGGTGGDTLRGDASANRLIGGAGDDILIGGDGDLVEGGEGSDTLPGPAGDATWTITGLDAGRVGGLTFSGIENLRGAAGNQDTFVIEPGGSLTGRIQGGAGGFDTLIVTQGAYSRIVMAPGGPDSGRVTLDGVDILYGGLEPVVVPNAANMVVDLTAITDAVGTLQPTGVNTYELSSDNMGFETHTFTYLPGDTSLTVNLGTGNDTLTLKNLSGTSVDNELTITGGDGDDTFKFDDDWGIGVTIEEGANGGNDTLDFSLFSDLPAPRDWITIEPQLDGSVEIHGQDGSSLTLDSTTAQNFEDLTGANINLTGLAGSAEDELVGGLEKMVSFMRDLAAVGQLATALPLLGKNADVAVAKALDLAESIDEIRLEVKEFFDSVPTVTTDGLIERLEDAFFGMVPRSLTHLGAAILSPLSVTDGEIVATDSYDFVLTLDGGGPVNISATGAETVDELVKALNIALAADAATSGKVLAAARNGRIAFQAVGAEVDELVTKASGALNEAVTKLGFGNNIPVTLSDIQGILQDLGALKLSLASGVALTTDFEGGTPRLQLGVEYRANRESGFFYNLGEEAQSLGLAFDLQAAIAAKADLVFDFELGLALDDASLDFFLDVQELRAGISTTLSAETVNDVGLNIGFLSAEVDGSLSVDAGVVVDTTSLQNVTDPSAISLSPSDLTPTGSDGTGSPDFDLSLTIGVDSDLDSLGGFSASATLTAGGNPFDGENITLTVGGDIDQFLDFNNLNAAGVVSLLGQVRSWLDGVREGELFASLDIPFIQGGLDRILDLAEVVSDALLFDEGSDDARDGSDALVTDLNQALGDAGLGRLIRAQGDGSVITLVAIDPGISEFRIAKKLGNDLTEAIPMPYDGGGFADLGFANDTSDGTPDVIVGGAAVALGVLSGRAGFTVEVDLPGETISKDVRLKQEDTGNNTGVGDDTPKLLDADNAPTFATAQELAERLGQIILAGLVDYDTGTNVLTYEIEFSDVPLFSVELPTDFSLDLSPVGSVTSDTRLVIDAMGGVHFTIGFDLSDTPAGSTTLTDGTLLEDLGVEVKLEEAGAAAGAPRTIVGRLSGDASLDLSVTTASGTRTGTVFLRAPETTENTVVGDLVDDLNDALGVASLRSGALSSFNLSGDATFDISLDGDPAETVTVYQTDPDAGGPLTGTDDNTSLDDLIDDINNSIDDVAGLTGMVVAEADGNRILIKAVGGGGVTTFLLTALSSDPAVTELKLPVSGSAAVFDDLITASHDEGTLRLTAGGGATAFQVATTNADPAFRELGFQQLTAVPETPGDPLIVEAAKAAPKIIGQLTADASFNVSLSGGPLTLVTVARDLTVAVPTLRTGDLSSFTLSGNATFEVSLDGGPAHMVTVYQTDPDSGGPLTGTDDNADIDDLVADLNASINAVGALTGKIAASVDGSRIALKAIDPTVSRFRVTATAGNPAVTELKLPEDKTALPVGASYDNRNTVDLINDVQQALDEDLGSGVMEVTSEGGRLLFTRLGPTTPGTADQFTITPVANAGELGITGTVTSDEADLVITVDDGTKHRVVLDGAVDVGDVIAAIEAQTGSDVDAALTVDDPEGEATPVDETDTGLTLVDTTAPPDGGDPGMDPDASGQFMVSLANGSLAAVRLGLIGMDVNPNDASDLPDAKIVGAKIAGATLLDRFFITGSDPDDPSTLADVIDASLQVKAGALVEGIEIVSENGTDTVITSTSFEFKQAHATDNLHLVIKDVAGLNAGTYQIDSVDETSNQATLTKVGMAGVAGEAGQAGGVGLLESGVHASARFGDPDGAGPQTGFIGIELSGTAELGAELSLGFNTNAGALADGKLTLQELVDGLGDILDLMAPPDLTPISPATDFGGLDFSGPDALTLSAGSADFTALASGLLGGSPSLTATVVTLGDPFLGTRFEQAFYAKVTGTQFTVMGDFTGKLPDGVTIRFSGSGGGDFTVDSTAFASGVTTVNVTPVESAVLPASLATFDVVLLPKVDIEHSGLGDLPNFDDIGFDDILAALQALANFLSQFEAFGFLNQDLPIIDQSVNDLLGFASKFLDAVEEAESNPAGTLQVLETKINEAIGIAAPQLLGFFESLQTDALDDVLGYSAAPNDVLDLDLVGGDILRLDLALGAGFSKGLDLAIPGIDFGSVLDSLGLGNILDLSGSAGLFAEGSVMLRLQIGVDLSDPTQIYLFEDSGIEAEIEVGGEDIAFKVGVGPFSLSIASTDSVTSSISIAATASVNAAGAPFDSDGKVLLSTALSYLDADLGGTAQGRLPVFFPNDATQIGEIKIGESVQAGFGNLANIGSLVLQTEESPSPAPTTDDFVIDVHEVIDGFSNFDFASFDLFSNILLAVDGLDLLLGTIQDLVYGTMGSSSIPLIGDDISKAAEFIQDLRDDFIAPLREALETAKNAAQDFALPDKNILSKAVYEILGPGGADLLRQQSGNGDSPGDFIGLNTNLMQYLDGSDPSLELKDTYIEWDLKLGQDPFIKSTDIGFDLGIPGLGLETEGDILLTLQWELDLTFGISGTDGFYFRVDDPHELLFDIAVTLPGAGITGTLGFLELRGVNKELTVDGQPRNTTLGATFKVDVFEDGASGTGADGTPDAERLGFTELGSIGFDAGVAAEAAATLGLSLGLSGELFSEIFGGGASDVIAGFPKVVGDFVFLWELGNRHSNVSGLEARANAIEAADDWQSFDDFSTNSIADGLKLVGFQDIGLDLGTFLSDVLGPIVDEVSKYTEPLQPIIDFITSPIPIIGQLGLEITWLDLAAAIAGDTLNVDLIKSIAEIITLINDIAAVSGAGAVILPIGDMTIYDNLGTFLPNVNLWDAKADTGALFEEIQAVPGLIGNLIEDAGGIVNALGSLAGGLGGSQAETASTLMNVTSGQSAGGFAFPFLEDPSQIFGLLLGKEVDLITYDLGAFEFHFEFSQFFSIFGPLGVSIGLIVDIMADTAFGYDTLGIRQFVESGFRNPGLLFNGFFISDSPKLDGNDDPELTFAAELVAAAELNLGIARAGVAASFGFQILFDLFDPDRDGKIRFAEILGNIENQLKSDEPALAPLAMFDVSGEIFARLFAFLEIDLGFFTFEEEFPIFGPVTLLSFEIDFFRPPILASEVDANGDLIVHAGEFADQRLLGNATDIAEHLIIQSAGTDGDFVNVQIKSGDGALGEDSQTFLDYKVRKGSKIIIDGGEGDDTFDLSGFAENQVLFEIDGGAGNDTITLGAGTGVANKFSVIQGGSGDDIITGGGGSDLIYGGTGTDDLGGGGGDDLLFGDEGEIATDRVRGLVRPSDGADTLDGGGDSDIVFGGGGRDTVGGGDMDDLVLGGGGLVVFTSAGAFKTFDNMVALENGGVSDAENLVQDPTAGDTVTGGGGDDFLFGTAGPDTIEGNAGEDIIFGLSGFDHIDAGDNDDIVFGDGGKMIGPDEGQPTEGGSNDDIQGGAGTDTIFGGGGGDLIQGGAGDDTIHGGPGPDVIFGDNHDNGTPPAPDELGSDGIDVIFGEGEPDRIFGGGDSDRIDGGAGPDDVKGGSGNDLMIANKSSDIMNGEEGSDTYTLSFQGGNSASVMKAFDSGTLPGAVDRLIANGTVFDDLFLLRANTSGSLAFVALVNNEFNVERINYNKSIERIVVNGSFGKDHFAVDDSVSDITLNGEFDDDTFQVGQLFRSNRGDLTDLQPPPVGDGFSDITGVSADDIFANIEVTRGWLSNGISAPMTINGGLGNDLFRVFHNLAVLQLNGDEGDDTFEIRAFALAGSQEPQRERTDISGGAGADLVQYAVNAPVNIDGGDGFDRLIVIGTEFGDDFVVTEDGVYGAGLNVNFVNIESLRVDGAEGDDRFYLKSTSEKFVTELFGGLGDDTFNMSGDTPPIVSNDLLGHSGLVLHGVESLDPRYNDQKVFGISANVADNDEPFAVIRQTGGSTIVDEGSSTPDTYEVVLTRKPETDVLLNVLAPLPTPDSRERRMFAFRVDSPTEFDPDGDGDDDGSFVVLKFTPANWYFPQTVQVYADTTALSDTGELFMRPELGDGAYPIPFDMDDPAAEGLRFGVINTLVTATRGAAQGTLVAIDNNNLTPTVTIPDAPGPLTADDLLGRSITIDSGPGFGQSRLVVGVVDEGGPNTVLTLDRAFAIGDVPDTTSKYTINIDDAIVGVMTAFQEDAFVGLDEDDERSIFEDSNASFPTVGEGLRGRILEIIGGDGAGQQRLILGHVEGFETTKLILNGPWRTDPEPNESVYRIKRYDGLALPSVLVQINDNDKAGLVIDETQGFEDPDLTVTAADITDDFDTITTVIEGGDGDHLGEQDIVRVRLSRDPGATDVEVGLLYDAAQLVVTDLSGTPIDADNPLVFNSGNWSTFQPLLVKGLTDLTREGFHTGLIQFQVQEGSANETVLNQVDDFEPILPENSVYYVGLTERPVAGSTTVTLDAGMGPVVLTEADEDGLNGQYVVLSNKIVFVDATGDLVQVSGDLEVEYDYIDTGFLTAFTPPILTRMSDADAPAVLVRQTGGSTDVIELRRGGADPDSIPVGDYDSFKASNDSPWFDSYEFVLTAEPTDDVTITVTPADTKTTRTGGIVHEDIQVEISSGDARAVADGDNLIVTFDDTNWDEPVVIKVAALDDAVVDGSDTQVFAPGPNTLSGILGPVVIDGAGGEGSLNIGRPVMLPGEINIKEKTGDVAAPVSGTQVTVDTDDLVDILDDFDLEDVSELVNKTIEVTAVNDPENLFHSAIGQFRLITAVSSAAGLTTLTINEAFELNLDGNTGETDADIKSYAITAESLNFFVDETTQVDFMFVHDEDSPADHSGVLTPTRLYGLNMGPDLVIGGELRPRGITYGNLEVIEINLGTGNNDFTVLGTPTRRDDGYQTWTFLNTGDDIEWQGVQGDTVIVRLNEDDAITASGTITSAENVNAGALIFKNTATIEGSFADDALAGQIIRILDSDPSENVSQAANQVRRIIGNTGGVLWVDRPWEFLPDGEPYEILNEADGAFAVNTEGGDDTVDASASTLGITIFGGLGEDDLTGGSGADAIFGDRGRVDYFNEDGAIVTRLGDAPDPITGFVTTQVTPQTLTTLVDSGASFPVPDDAVDGAGTDDIGLRGLYVDINNGKGFLQTIRLITENTADTLTIDPGFDTEEDLPGPDVEEPSEYRISTMPENQTDGVVRDPGLLLTVDNDLGAMDTIDAGPGADQVFGGAGGDDINAGADDDLVVGDAGRLDRSRDPDAPEPPVVHDHDEGRIEVRSFYDRLRTIAWDEGDDDTLGGGAGADLVLGGHGGDTIYGDDEAGSSGAGDAGDAIQGDQGEFEFTDGVLVSFFTTSTTETDGGVDDIHGNAGDDTLLGAIAGDRMFGDAADDLALGDFAEVTLSGGIIQQAETIDRTLGGSDTIFGGADDDMVAGGAYGDVLDGDEGDDLIFGDNLVLGRRPDPGDTTNARYRALVGSQMYDAEGNVLVDRTAQYANPVHVPAWADWDFTLFDHSFADEAAALSNFGDDYIAGGPDDDTIFAMLGDDIVQGDGSIDSLDMGGPGVSAFRDGSGMLVINPSSEDASDGDDYIEGNGGEDVIFGNLGQDDIIGGSSELFSLSTPSRRPDGADLIFGGAGTAAGRNHDGDLSAEGHARDADTILGDNGNIFRLTGLNGADGGAYLTFNYDTYAAGLRIIPRAADPIDYTPGGADVDPVLQATDIGAPDEVHGEGGDDAVYGMKGGDFLFGDGQDDDLIGGYGHDWFSGGTGDDGIIGDDGRIFTSRNVAMGTGGPDPYAEPLYGILKVDQVDQLITTPGNIQMATINVDAQLKKTVNLEPYHLTPAGQMDDPLRDPADADDIAYGGLGNDFIHGNAGDDALSGAEALPQFFDLPFNPGNVLRFGQVRAEEFAAYNEFAPLRKVFVDANGEFVENPGPGDSAFLLNFDATEGPLVAGSATIHADGDDRMFGDHGNDWMVGGTGEDHMFGGWGSDLLNADDDHDSTAGGADPLANDVPDTHATYEDIAYGGAGRDYIIGNTGGDRLIDWVGEYNSYLLPFAPYGTFTVARTLQPQLPEYLYALSASGGADPTRAADTGGDPARNGEPDGEIGLVLQQDFAWQDQTGAPDDPQAGNIPGGPRDTMKGADFNQGNMSAFAPDSGSWYVDAGVLKVSAWDSNGDAVSVFHVEDALPNYFEVLASINAGKPTKGWKANAFIIFDYYSPTDFKFAGVNASLDKLQMGHRTPEGWIVDVQTPAQVRPETFYNMMVAVHGTNVTLLVDNTTIFNYTFAPRIVDGRSVGLNEGMVGVGSLSARGLFDNVRVQKVPPAITLEWTDDFGDGSAERFTGATTGAWEVLGGRYQGAPAAGAERATNLIDLGLPRGLAASSILELEGRLSTQGMGGFVFDQYGPDDFKFVGIDTATDRVIIGHRTARGGWVTDAFASRALEPGQDYRLAVSLRGTSVSVSLDGQVVAGHVYNGVVVDGGFGLLARDGASSFDSVMMRTDDRAFAPVAGGSSEASVLSSPTSGTLSASLVYDGGATTDLSAADGGADTDAVTLPDYLVHDWVVDSRGNGNGSAHERTAAHGLRIDFDGLAGRRYDRGEDEGRTTVDLGGDWLLIGSRRDAEDLLS